MLIFDLNLLMHLFISCMYCIFIDLLTYECIQHVLQYVIYSMYIYFLSIYVLLTWLSIFLSAYLLIYLCVCVHLHPNSRIKRNQEASPKLLNHLNLLEVAWVFFLGDTLAKQSSFLIA